MGSVSLLSLLLPLQAADPERRVATATAARVRRHGVLDVLVMRV
ncbi:MAG TPA: hypothetical protein VFV40_10865 [Nocardioides sp.]|nr:hypothetical protein [Nocardioides sp.]